MRQPAPRKLTTGRLAAIVVAGVALLPATSSPAESADSQMAFDKSVLPFVNSYCVDCHGCTESSHCARSRDLHGCMHCSDSERCRSSAYLVRSVDCSGCTYCYGCVGLTRKDFHILNEPYDRSTYFDMVKKLDRALGHRA
jgi:hypothetical protein